MGSTHYAAASGKCSFSACRNVEFASIKQMNMEEELKKEAGLGILYVAIGVIALLIPRIIFPVCGLDNNPFFWSDTSQFHGCQGTLKVVTILGLLVIAFGGFLISRPQPINLLISAAAVSIIGILTILFPFAITGMCKVATMPCRLGTLPALIAIGVLMDLAGTAGIFIFIMNKKNEKN